MPFQKVLRMSTLMLLICTVCSFAFGQKKGKNLVPNPSFEFHKNKAPVIKNAVPWVNVGTVDYYMKPEKKDTSKYKGARTGTCYAGLRFQPEYKEYMYVKLLEPLEKDAVYSFRMYVRLLGVSTVTVKQLGVYFSDQVFKVGMEFDEEGLIDSTYKKGISGQGWVPIKGDYVAHGGEQYIIIGNFRTKMKDDFVRKNKFNIFDMREAYYYVDDVSVRKKLIPKDSSGAAKVVKPLTLELPNNFEQGQVIELKNLQFEKGTDRLLKISQKLLDELVTELNERPFMEIEINGYTDNAGNEAANRKLSKERAKAVYDYLKAEGVVNPMTYRGLGPANPVAPNDTEENRAKNRRLEIVIIKE